MASKIQEIVIRLATYMEQRTMRGMLKIIFRNGQGILEFILRQCDINLKFKLLLVALFDRNSSCRIFNSSRWNTPKV